MIALDSRDGLSATEILYVEALVSYTDERSHGIRNNGTVLSAAGKRAAFRCRQVRDELGPAGIARLREKLAELRRHIDRANSDIEMKQGIRRQKKNLNKLGRQ